MRDTTIVFLALECSSPARQPKSCTAERQLWSHLGRLTTTPHGSCFQILVRVSYPGLLQHPYLVLACVFRPFQKRLNISCGWRLLDISRVSVQHLQHHWPAVCASRQPLPSLILFCTPDPLGPIRTTRLQDLAHIKVIASMPLFNISLSLHTFLAFGHIRRLVLDCSYNWTAL